MLSSTMTAIRTKLRTLCKRLSDPQDTAAATQLAAVLLLAEAALTALIIWRVPCTCYKLRTICASILDCHAT